MVIKFNVLLLMLLNLTVFTNAWAVNGTNPKKVQLLHKQSEKGGSDVGGLEDGLLSENGIVINSLYKNYDGQIKNVEIVLLQNNFINELYPYVVMNINNSKVNLIDSINVLLSQNIYTNYCLNSINSNDRTIICSENMMYDLINSLHRIEYGISKEPKNKNLKIVYSTENKSIIILKSYMDILNINNLSKNQLKALQIGLLDSSISLLAEKYIISENAKRKIIRLILAN